MAKYSSSKSNNIHNLQLTKRESEVLTKIVLGHTCKEIGRLLGISYRTVEAYVDILKFKLGCHSKREIIKRVITTRLIFDLELIDGF